MENINLMKKNKLFDAYLRISDKIILPIFFLTVCMILFQDYLELFEFTIYMWYIIVIFGTLATIGVIIKFFIGKKK